MLMTQLSICQDQIEREIKRIGQLTRRDDVSQDKVSFRRMTCLYCQSKGKHGCNGNHSIMESERGTTQEKRELSLNGMLEDEALKNNQWCNAIREAIKKQVTILKTEDMKLIGDDTTLIRMINFFNNYKKRYEEWKRRQDQKDRLRALTSKPDPDDPNDVSRREQNLRNAKKLKPYYYPPTLAEEQSEEEARKKEEETAKKNSEKDPLLIKDRSILGQDRFYSPEVPENVLYVDDASVAADPSVAGSKYYLTEGERSVSGKRKVTLNLKIPKSKLQNLKNIRALIRTRDPNSNALVAKEKAFNLEYVAETVATNNEKLGKKYHFRTNGESSVKNSIHDRSTELASNFPSIAPEKRASVKNPITVEKVEFGKKSEQLQLPDIKRKLF